MNTSSTPTNGPSLRSPLARRALAVAALVVLGSLALPAAAAVYKWVDPQGRIHYSDRPPPPEGKLLSVDTSSSSNAQSMHARAGQCKQAQEKYQNYVTSRRLYKEGPNKERIYLSDQELETERLNAKHEVDELCNGD